MSNNRSQSASKLMKLLAVLFAFAMFAVACGGDDEGSSESSGSEEGGSEEGESEEAAEGGDEEDQAATQETVEDEPVETGPVAGGTLRYGIDAEADGINPAQSALSPGGLTMGNMVFDTLAAYAADGETVVPYLAESIEPVDDTFTAWTVTVRPDISFHDGTPLNADALVANFEAQLGDLLVGLAVAPFFDGVDEKITVVDDLTVQYNLAEANAYFPATLTSQLGMVASPTWLEAAAEDGTLNQMPVGTGPFIIESRTPDSETVFVRNDEYWAGEVYLDSVVIVPVPDTATRVDLFTEGDLSGFMANDSSAAQAVMDSDEFKVGLDDTGEESFVMINTEVPPFDDIRVRQALTFSTAREAYNELIGLGVRRPAEQMFNPESPYYNPDVMQESDNPEAAVPLIEEYCAENGDLVNPVLDGPVCTDGKVNMEFQYSGPSVIQDRIAEILGAGWGAGGFNVTNQIIPEDDHIQQTAFGQYNVNTWRQFGTGDPAADKVWLWCKGVGGISLNWPRLCDEARDEVLLEAMSTTDQARRVELYQQLSEMVANDYTYVFLLRAMWVNAYQGNVNGVCERTSPEGEPLYCSLNGRTWFTTAWISE